jgi:glycosyltransferase involved in cell wall biosynthesis
MDVAIITNEYPPYNNKGGIATFNIHLAELLEKEGRRVIVFTDAHNKAVHPVIKNNITIIPFIRTEDINILRFLLHLLPLKIINKLFNRCFPSTKKLIVLNIMALCTYMAYRKKYAITIIHTPVLFASAFIISLVFPEIRLITHAHGPDELLQPYDSVTKDSVLRAKIEAFFMRTRSAKIVCCSRSIAAYLETKYPTMHGKLIYIPNFIDTSDYPEERKKPDINRLLFMGRLEKRKGPDLVFSAFIKLAERYPKLTVYFVGEDTDSWGESGRLCTFRQYVSQFRLPDTIKRRVHFLTRIDNRTSLIRYLVSHPGVAILPSRYEPFGFVYIETMMTGWVTIASKSGGGSEIIQNGKEGFLVNPTDEDIISTVKYIQTLRSSHLSQIIRNAREKVVRAYDVSRVKSAYRRLYKDIV